MATQTRKAKDAPRTLEPAPDAAPSSETPDEITIRRPARVRLSSEDTRARVKAFAEREEAFIAAVREDEG